MAKSSWPGLRSGEGQITSRPSCRILAETLQPVLAVRTHQVSSEGQLGIGLSFLCSSGPLCESMMGSFPQAVVGGRRIVVVAPAAAQVSCILPDGPGLSWDPRHPRVIAVCPHWGSVLSARGRKVLLLYPNCCSLGRWMASLACVWSCFSAGSPDSVHSPSSTLELKSLSHPIPSLLSSGTVCIQLIADALNPKVHRESLCQGPASCQPVGGEAVRLVGSCQHSLFPLWLFGKPWLCSPPAGIISNCRGRC